MNGFYGVRIPESFRSEERWYEINRFGGILLLLWGLAVGVTGFIGLIIPQDWGRTFSVISVGVVLGGIFLVAIGIFVDAAMTKKD
jgi:uncharacterized membrane protein